MKKILKNGLNNKLRASWEHKSLRTESAAAEETHGIVMLFTELSTSCIGFEGFGFFTLTYSLIGSVSHYCKVVVMKK